MNNNQANNIKKIQNFDNKKVISVDNKIESKILQDSIAGESSNIIN